MLLDTAPLLWLAAGSEALSETVVARVLDPDNEVFVSSVSAWEIAVKYGLGRLRLQDRPERLLPQIREAYGITSLPLTEEAALTLHRLPALHRDPFDRMLVCQAIAHGLTLATPDGAIQRYPVSTIW